MKLFGYIVVTLFVLLLVGPVVLRQVMKPAPVVMSLQTELGVPIAGWNRAVERGSEGLAQEHVTWNAWRSGADEFMRMVSLRARFEPVPDDLPRFPEAGLTLRVRVVTDVGVELGERDLVLVHAVDDRSRWAIDAITPVD